VTLYITNTTCKMCVWMTIQANLPMV